MGCLCESSFLDLSWILLRTYKFMYLYTFICITSVYKMTTFGHKGFLFVKIRHKADSILSLSQKAKY